MTKAEDDKHAEGHLGRRRLTIAGTKATFDDTRVRDAFTVRWFARPVADLCTPAFYNRGWTANDVTYLRAGISLLAIFGLLSADRLVLGIVVIVYYANFILDCVDGNLARVADTTTYWGKFVDGLADGVYGLLAPFALGIGLWLATSDGRLLVAGAATSTAAIYCEMVRSRRGFVREWMVAQTGPLSDEERSDPPLLSLLERICVWVIVNALFFLPLLLFLADGRQFYLLGLVFFQGIASITWLIVILLQAHRILHRWRKSSHAVLDK